MSTDDPTDERPVGRRRLRALALAVFLVVASAGLVVVALDARHQDTDQDRLLYAASARIRAEIEGELYRNLSLATGLRSFVIANPALDADATTRIILDDLVRQGRHIRNIGLAPDNVLEVVHPIEGNEGAIGLDYRTVPAQWADVERAMRSRETILAGPVDLVQGGRGLINRTPVFLADGRYWGIVSLVLDVDSLLANVQEDTDALQVRWGARTVTASDGEPLELVGGTPTAFDQPSAQRVTFGVLNQTWEVAAAPRADAGWSTRTVLLAASVLLASALLAVLVHQLLVERHRSIAQARHDALTGLANRRVLEERLDDAVRLARRANQRVSLVYVDLDRFKPINDEHGHGAGDHVLQLVARRLAARARETDLVARVGGDEFVVLAPDTDAAGAATLARALREVVQRPIVWRETQLELGASTGTATLPGDAETAEELLAAADGAMFALKRTGRPLAVV